MNRNAQGPIASQSQSPARANHQPEPITSRSQSPAIAILQILIPMVLWLLPCATLLKRFVQKKTLHEMNRNKQGPITSQGPSPARANHQPEPITSRSQSPAIGILQSLIPMVLWLLPCATLLQRFVQKITLHKMNRNAQGPIASQSQSPARANHQPEPITSQSQSPAGLNHHPKQFFRF